MDKAIKNLTPAELIVIVFNKHINNVIRYFIKYTIYDFVFRGIITIQKKKIKCENEGKQSAYFVKCNKNHTTVIMANLHEHEKGILAILPNKSKWISYQEFVTKLSYFENNKFRATSKKYQIEKQIINELIKNQIFTSYSYKVLGITLWKKNELSPKGKDIRKLLLDRNTKINDYTWLKKKYSLFNSNCNFFNSNIFFDIDNNFDHYFQHALDYMDTVVAAPIHWLKTYPELLD